MKHNNSCFLIAEIGQAHDGSLGILHSYIDALSKTGIDALKFQTHIADAESSPLEPFRVNFSYEDHTRFDYWKRMEFSQEQWAGIKKHCDDVGIEFLSSPFSLAAVDLLESIGISKHKIGSGEVLNFLMLEKICNTGKPIILSSGMSSFDELDQTVRFIEKRGNELSILQCTTEYPTPYERLGLNVISELRNRYPNHKIGLSEHTGQIFAGIAAAVLGVDILEFHAVFDKRIFGPDATSSLTIAQVKELVSGVRSIETSKNNPIDKNDITKYSTVKKIFQKSLAINKDLPKGHIISMDDLESKKPLGYGISAMNYRKVIGRQLCREMKKWEFLNENDLRSE